LNLTVTSSIYTLSLHDALPISSARRLRECASRAAASPHPDIGPSPGTAPPPRRDAPRTPPPSRPATIPAPLARPGRTRTACTDRSEEHTSELQSQSNLVCRLLL